MIDADTGQETEAGGLCPEGASGPWTAAVTEGTRLQFGAIVPRSRLLSAAGGGSFLAAAKRK